MISIVPSRSSSATLPPRRSARGVSIDPMPRIRSWQERWERGATISRSQLQLLRSDLPRSTTKRAKRSQRRLELVHRGHPPCEKAAADAPSDGSYTQTTPEGHADRAPEWLIPGYSGDGSEPNRPNRRSRPREPVSPPGKPQNIGWPKRNHFHGSAKTS